MNNSKPVSRLLIAIILSVVSSYAFSQDYQSFYKESLNINKTGMYVLGSWALANITIGAVGWAKSSGSTKYFHQMNLFWNSINLTIASVGLYNAFTTDVSILTNSDIFKKHMQIEKLFLINAGLDILYMGSGVFLKHLSTKKEKYTDLLKGYGNSLIMQGAFLFSFDIVMYFIQRNHRISGNITDIAAQFKFSPDGFYLCFYL